jgi:hypothetical protein
VLRRAARRGAVGRGGPASLSLVGGILIGLPIARRSAICWFKRLLFNLDVAHVVKGYVPRCNGDGSSPEKIRCLRCGSV